MYYFILFYIVLYFYDMIYLHKEKQFLLDDDSKTAFTIE